MFIRRIQVKNFRTLEDFQVNFVDYYTAICGKNNSGKSSLIRAIRFLMSSPPELPWEMDEQQISYKRDITRWKSATEDEIGPISFTLDLEFDSSKDFSLVSFVDRLTPQASQSKKPSDDSLKRTLQLILKIHSQEKESTTELRLDGNPLDDLAAQEIVAKIRAATTMIFHDSTATHFQRWSSRVHGYFEDLPSEDQEAIKKKQKTLTNALRKALDPQKEEFTSMIGRLEEKYEVDLSIPDISFLSIPVGISLGEKSFAIPLDEWGSGTRNQTIILKRMFDARRAANAQVTTERLTPVIVIEEPEAFLHPLAQAQFGRVLQDLAGELEIQIIATTHSPYMLSHKEPDANVLLSRRIHRNSKFRETQVVTTEGPDWKKPYEHALGVMGPEFELFKEAIFTKSSSILLVEGDIDKEYLELLTSEDHNKDRLQIPGEIYSYGGWGTLKNNVLLKFIKDRFSSVVVTVDLDALSNVEQSLVSLGFEKDKSLIVVGQDKPGMRSIEGLLPNQVKQTVRAANPELVNAMESDNKDEAKEAKKLLKSLYLAEFKRVAEPGKEYYSGLYELATKINRAFEQLRKK